MPVSAEKFEAGASGWFSEVKIALFLVEHEGKAYTAYELFEALGHGDLLGSSAPGDPFRQFGVLWAFHQALHHVAWDLMTRYPPEGRTPELDKLLAAIRKGFTIRRRRLGDQLYYCAIRVPPTRPAL